MTKNEFIRHYEIADAKPVDPSKKALPAEALSYALAEFMKTKFNSVVSVSCNDISAQSVLVCAEYVAQFFKTLIADVYGRVTLNIDLSTDKDKLYVTISAEDGLPLSQRELRDLIRLARNGGFEVAIANEAIKLYTGFTPTVARRVYAVSVADGKRIMLGKLIEIFCHGELLRAEDINASDAN